jgi:hypothetical protein
MSMKGTGFIVVLVTMLALVTTSALVGHMKMLLTKLEG